MKGEYYRMDRFRRHGFEHLEIAPVGSCRCGDMVMHWQAEEGSDWYGFSLQLEVRSLDELKARASLARRILSAGCDPEEVLAALKRMGWKRAIYDPRTHRYVELAAPEEKLLAAPREEGGK